jgi:hypothetical protein
MGDKSPKAKDKLKKQDKNSKKSAAMAKSTPVPAAPVKRGK